MWEGDRGRWRQEVGEREERLCEMVAKSKGTAITLNPPISGSKARVKAPRGQEPWVPSPSTKEALSKHRQG